MSDIVGDILGVMFLIGFILVIFFASCLFLVAIGGIDMTVVTTLADGRKALGIIFYQKLGGI